MSLSTSPLVICIDFAKAIMTPKVSSQIAYFKRKLKTRLLGIYVATITKMFACIWTENIGGKGPDQVISALHHLFLTSLRDHTPHLIIWSDNCPSEFKCNRLLFYAHWLVNTGVFDRIDLKFLVPGHTYGVCDRKFGNFEHIVERYNVLSTPDDWARAIERVYRKDDVEVVKLDLKHFMNWEEFLGGLYVKRDKGNRDGVSVDFRFANCYWFNFGIGQRNNENKAEAYSHNHVWVRESFDALEEPIEMDFGKKKQIRKSERLNQLHDTHIPMDVKAKNDALYLAKEFCDEKTINFYKNILTDSTPNK